MGLKWSPHYLPVTATKFKLRNFEQFQGYRVTVLEGTGESPDDPMRNIIYWFDEKDSLIARFDPSDKIDTARGVNDGPHA